MTRKLVIAGWALCGCTVLLWADGGTLQFRKQAGPFDVSVFSEPAPVRVGTADLSVMLQRHGETDAVMNASVQFHLRRPEADRIVEFVVPATHDKATNKTLYASSLNLPSAGQWLLSVDVRTKEGEGTAAGALNVLPPAPPLEAHWQLFIAVPLMIVLFALNQWLKRKMGLRRQPVRR